jgi:hypothetical protein
MPLVRKAAAPLSPRRTSAWIASPVSTNNPLYPIIIDLERLRRVMSRKKRREAAAHAISDEDTKVLQEVIRNAEAAEMEKARERAKEAEKEAEGGSEDDANPNANTANANANATLASSSAGKENNNSVKPTTSMKRPDPRTRQREKIVPPPVFEGWRKSSLDRVMSESVRGSGSSELASPPAVAVAPPPSRSARPISILANTTNLVAGGGFKAPLPSSTPSEPAIAAAGAGKRPKVKLPPIKTTSFHPDDVPTRPVSPVQNGMTPSVVYTPQQQTDSPVASRRDSVQFQQGGRRDSNQGQQQGSRRGSVNGLSHVHEALARKATRARGDTQLTDRTDRTDRTDKTDRTDGTDGSHPVWYFEEPEEIGSPVEEEESPQREREQEERMARSAGAGPSRMPSFGATAALAMAGGELLTTRTMAGHAISSAAAAGGGKTLPVRATSLLRAKSRDAGGEKEKKKKKFFPQKRHPRRCLSPEERFCSGWCRKRYEEDGVDGKMVTPFVVSWCFYE